MSASLAGRLAARMGGLGPVVGVSYRVASRIANTLRSGTAAKSSAALDPVRLVLFHSPPEQVDALIESLSSVEISWAGKCVLILDCDPPESVAEWFTMRGASVGWVRNCGVPGRLRVDGTGQALVVAQRLVRDLGMKPIEIPDGAQKHFEAALLLGTAALTPLLDQAVDLLRRSGMRDTEAVAVGTALFEQTVRNYGYSGRQSWAWYNRAPEPETISGQIEGTPEPLASIVRNLLLVGFDSVDRHPETARALKKEIQAETA